MVGGTSSFIMSVVRRRSKTGPAVADPAAVISQVGWCMSVEALVDQKLRSVILNKAPPRAGATQEKRKRTCVNDPLSVSRVPAFTVQDFGLVAAGEVNCASLKVRSCSFGF